MQNEGKVLARCRSRLPPSPSLLCAGFPVVACGGHRAAPLIIAFFFFLKGGGMRLLLVNKLAGRGVFSALLI